MPDTPNNAGKNIRDLPRPARYFPIRDGRYSAGAGLFRLGHDFGNAEQDQQLFQFDACYPRYRDNTCTVRQSITQPHYAGAETDSRVEQAVTRFLCQQLATQHPAWFRLHDHRSGYRLDCRLSNEQLEFSPQGALLATTQSSITPPYQNSLDAIASQCQEDIALMSIDEQGRLVDVHLCAPNHWCPQAMSGKDILGLHSKVPGFSEANPAAEKLLPAIYNKGPYVRFAWGIQTDEQLNRHPAQPRPATENPPLYMRVERQVLWPIPHCSRLLFTIRTYFLDCATLTVQEHLALHSSLRQMDDASLRYKGIDRDKVLQHLATLLHTRTP